MISFGRDYPRSLSQAYSQTPNWTSEIEAVLFVGLVYHFTPTIFPPVIFCKSSIFNSNMALGVPAAAQMT